MSCQVLHLMIELEPRPILAQLSCQLFKYRPVCDVLRVMLGLRGMMMMMMVVEALLLRLELGLNLLEVGDELGCQAAARERGRDLLRGAESSMVKN